ncbi:hypothetical protein NDU88_001722, partial [Pleurodeles waltl]
KECRKCGFKEHFSRLCHGLSKRSVATLLEEEGDDNLCETNLSTDRVLVVEDGGIRRPKEQRPEAQFVIRGKPVELMVDSGSLYTIIPRKLFTSVWPQVRLLPKDISP